MRLFHFFLRLGTGLIWLYGLLVIGYGGLRLVVGDTWNVVQLFDDLLPPLLLPALVLLPLLLISRRWRLALLIAPGVIGFGLIYGGKLLPHSRAAIHPVLTVMTYNLHNTNHNFDSMAAEIRRSNADLVLVEEVTAYTDRQLTHLVSDLYPYSTLFPFRPTRLGLGVYSRLPLTDQEFQRFSQESSLLRFGVTVDGQPIRVYVVHAANPFTFDHGFDPYPHNLATGRLRGELSHEHAPLIVAGDFNMTDQTGDYRRLTSVLTDTYREAGADLGLTFPGWSPIPLVRIDYVFHNAAFVGVGGQVSPTTGGSDHHPMRVQLAFAPP